MKRNNISRLLFLALFLNCMNLGISSSVSGGVEKANIIDANKSVESMSRTRKIIEKITVEKITVKDAITYTLISATLIACIVQHVSISRRFSAMEGRVYYLEGRVRELLGPPPAYEPPPSSE